MGGHQHGCLRLQREIARSPNEDTADLGIQLLDLACAGFLQAKTQLPRLLSHGNSGHLVLEAIQGALPAPNATKVARQPATLPDLLLACPGRIEHEGNDVVQLLHWMGAGAQKLRAIPNGLVVLKSSMELTARNDE